MLPQLIKFKGVALDFLFPQRCLGCGEEGELLCRICQNHLPRIVPPLCPQCGKPQASGIVCPECIGQPSLIDGIRSPFRFEGLIREAIHQFKYKNLRSLATPMASFLKDYLNTNPLPFPIQVIVPVPLHPRRLRERGYNQSFLLAKELGRQLNIPVVNNILARRKYMTPQARTKSVEERLNNVREAFTCNNNGLQSARVLLIDDVSTSGATLKACAATLKSSGTASVWGLTLAREI